ncbi:MAG: tetratricopeptide repeat protein [Kiritimatiellaeota bacterium]|nr:tetratricopeptide repeat protein [Kiritimatiellota bacterium]
MHDEPTGKTGRAVTAMVKTVFGVFFFLLAAGIFFGFGLSAGLTGWRLVGLALSAGTFAGLGAVVGAPAAAGLLGRSAGGLFFPEASFDKPQPAYGPAEAMAAAGRLEEALAAFEKTLEEFPGEYRAYARMIEILLYELRDTDRAAAVLERAGNALPDAGEKAELEGLFREACEEIAQQQTGRGRVELAPGEEDT